MNCRTSRPARHSAFGVEHVKRPASASGSLRQQLEGRRGLEACEIPSKRKSRANAEATTHHVLQQQSLRGEIQTRRRRDSRPPGLRASGGRRSFGSSSSSRFSGAARRSARSRCRPMRVYGWHGLVPRKSQASNGLVVFGGTPESFSRGFPRGLPLKPPQKRGCRIKKT